MPGIADFSIWDQLEAYSMYSFLSDFSTQCIYLRLSLISMLIVYFVGNSFLFFLIVVNDT